MKKKIISIILNQYFIAFCITIATLAILPNYFLKYKIILKERNFFERENQRVYFADLDNDFKSEKIYCFDNNNKQASLNIFTEEGDLIDQWNFNSFYPKKAKTLWFLDANNNGFNEIYIVTQKKDSAFLNVIEPFVKKGINKRHIFIDLIQAHNKEFKFSSSQASLLKSGIENEVVFTLETGFSGSPRNAYKYNLSQNKIYKSSHLTNKSAVSQVVDIDNDGKNEILLSNHSAGNKLDTLFTKRTDNSSWLMLLNNNLSFRFRPVEFKALFSGLQSFIFKSKNDFKIVSLLNSKQLKIKPATLYLFSITGKKLKEKALPFFGQNNDLFYNTNKKIFTIQNRNTGLVKVFNANFKELKNFYIRPNAFLYQVDIDNNGKKEWLCCSINQHNNSITIYNKNFKQPVSFNIPVHNFKPLKFGLKQINKYKNDLYFQKGNEYFIYGYTKNPLYFIKYLIYLGVYLVVLSLVFFIIKGQKLREFKKKAIEKEIVQLQLKTIKNQVDSHFVFNAINTISEMKLMDNKLEADNFICQFSDFMRKTLQQSESISNSLADEIAYVQNYLELQKVRFKNRFIYQIKVDKDVNIQKLIPKHVLFTYVENAIKHGLYNKPNGLLKIKVQKQKQNLLLIIEDNGGGIDETKHTKRNSTGNGLLIMEKIYALYSQLNNEKITHHLSEVLNENKVIGLKIQVLIGKQIEYSNTHL